MKKIVSLSIIFLTYTCLNGQDAAQEMLNNDRVFTIVPDMPRFMDPTCEAIESEQERNRCANLALRDYLKRHYRYPEGTGDICIEGIIVITFIVDKSGKVVEPSVRKGLHPLFDQAALELVSQLPDFISGGFRAYQAPVRLNIPISIRLLE